MAIHVKKLNKPVLCDQNTCTNLPCLPGEAVPSLRGESPDPAGPGRPEGQVLRVSLRGSAGLEERRPALN